MTDAQKADAAEHVRTETLHAWEGYKKYAWGHDSLKPLTKQPFDWYGPGHSLLMTPVDALDTLILMGLKPQADEAEKLIDSDLNLNQDIYVKDFEITIRLLGALISCYEGTGDKRLLELADELGRRMLPMFDSPTGMPYEYVNLRTGAVRGTVTNPAEIGSLLIEFGTLSQLTGKPDLLRQGQARIGGALQAPLGHRPGWLRDRRRDRQMDGPDRRHHGRHRLLLRVPAQGVASLRRQGLRSRCGRSSSDAIDHYLADFEPDGLWYGQADMNTGKRTSTHYGALDAFSACGADAGRGSGTRQAIANFELQDVENRRH